MGRIQIETVGTDGFSMDYFRFGQGRDPLVILPGLSVQSVAHYADAVASAYRSLTDAYTVFVFDRRKELPAVYPVADMARDTAAAMRVLGLRKTALFGASQGGMIAMLIAMRQPELVGKLVLCSTSARVAEPECRTVEQWARLAAAGNAADLYLAFGAAIYPQTVFEPLRAFLAETAQSVTDGELRRFAILAEGTRGFDVLQDLHQIRCPVFLVGSKDDAVLGFDATVQMAQRLQGRPGFALHVYDGFGHAAYDTAPDFRERMRQFLLADAAG